MNQRHEKDELRARFTAWLEWRLRREREHYLQRLEKVPQPIPSQELELLLGDD